MRFLTNACANAKLPISLASDHTRKLLNSGRQSTLNRPIFRKRNHLSLIARSEGSQGAEWLSGDESSVDVESSIEGNEDSVSQLKDLFRKADLNG